MLRRDVAFSRRSVLTEQDVQTLWELQAFRSRVFLTEEGVRAEVFFPGFRARIAWQMAWSRCVFPRPTPPWMKSGL